MRGVISAPQPEAAEAGADVLRDGGNAVDAAVACALVQTAVDPLMCGIAGFGTMHVFLPGADAGAGSGGDSGRGSGSHRVLDFHGRAPLAVREDMWADLVRGEAEDGFGFLLEGAVNEIGYQSITTPMTLRALDAALGRFGNRELPDLLPPAIEYCEDGFQVRPHVSAYWNEGPVWGRIAHTEYLTRFEATRKVYLRPDGRVPGVGDTVRNPDMGRTYRRIAEHGAEDFYTGRIAARIVADVEQGGGLLSAADLARATPDETDPLWGTYRGHRVSTNRPPGGGVMVLEMLNILENFDLAAMGHNSPEYIALVSEAMKIATVDKDTRIGDPRHFETPVAELASKEYGARMAERIRGGEKTHVPRLDAGGGESKGPPTCAWWTGTGAACRSPIPSGVRRAWSPRGSASCTTAAWGCSIPGRGGRAPSPPARRGSPRCARQSSSTRRAPGSSSAHRAGPSSRWGCCRVSSTRSTSG